MTGQEEVDNADDAEGAAVAAEEGLVGWTVDPQPPPPAAIDPNDPLTMASFLILARELQNQTLALAAGP